MNTQQSGGTPHTCKAVEHCHQLNDRVADLEGWVRLVDGATQRANGDIGDLRELANRMQGDRVVSERAFRDLIESLRRDVDAWHNALAEESRKHAAALATHRDSIDALDRESKAQAVAIQALGGRLDAIFRPELAHCPTCTCGQTFKLSYEAVAPTAPDCGGCAGQGAHKRWCPEVVGEKAARLGKWAEEADSLGDRIGANAPMASNACYNAAAQLTGLAQLARVSR